jgi:molecular chaperone GrpE
MKHNQNSFNENKNDGSDEFIISDSKGKPEPVVTKPETDAEFEVHGKKNENGQGDGNLKNKEHKSHGKPKESLEIDLSEIAEKKEPAGEKKPQPEIKENEELNAARKRIEELTDQNAAINDKYLRLMAEFDNFKRRSAKEYERMIEAANEKLMRDITEVRENFERAFKSNADAEKFLEGMKLISSKLNTILQKHGLEVYAESGQKFDPEVHDALMRMPHEEFAEGHIVEVHERGYKLKGNIIKHAKVVVSSGKPEAKENETETVIEIK